jgi:hypothetical protein
MWHPADPHAPRRAIPVLARLVAQGRLGAEEAAAALAAVPAHGVPCGWPARRAWALADAVADWERARRRAVWMVRNNLAPLLAARAPRSALEAAAAAADPAQALTPAERVSLLRAEVARALAAKVQPGRQKVQPGAPKVQPGG